MQLFHNYGFLVLDSEGTMRKLLSIAAVVLFSLVGISAAQRGQHGNNGGGRPQGQPRFIQHEQRSEPRHETHGRDDRHGDRAPIERHDTRNWNQNGYHWGRGNPRGHWDGRHFDHDYFVGHWGYGHSFYWGHCNWYGQRFYPGSYFWYGGAYFVIVDEIPPYWYDDEVYVDFVDDGYWLINPQYPGVRFSVNVRF